MTPLFEWPVSGHYALWPWFLSVFWVGCVILLPSPGSCDVTRSVICLTITTAIWYGTKSWLSFSIWVVVTCHDLKVDAQVSILGNEQSHLSHMWHKYWYPGWQAPEYTYSWFIFWPPLRYSNLFFGPHINDSCNATNWLGSRSWQTRGISCVLKIMILTLLSVTVNPSLIIERPCSGWSDTVISDLRD